jgi:hypothetical protein
MIQAPRTKSKMGHQGAKEQFVFQSPHQSPPGMKHIYYKF